MRNARHSTVGSRSVVLFLIFVLLTAAAATAVDLMLIQLIGRPAERRHLVFPWPFAISTACLVVGSLSLEGSLRAIRLEKQQRFRRSLYSALAAASLFIGFQLYGLWTLFPDRRTAEGASLESMAFVYTLAALHSVHFLVATLFVCLITAQACLGRYDHEYYWGVTVCRWFWHGLGIVWIAILAVFAITT